MQLAAMEGVITRVKSGRVVYDDHRTNRVDWLTGYIELGSGHLLGSATSPVIRCMRALVRDSAAM